MRHLRRLMPEVTLAGFALATYLTLDLLGMAHRDVDSESYILVARTLLAKGIFWAPPSGVPTGALRPLFTRTPGYPVIVAAAMVVAPAAWPLLLVWGQRLLWVAAVCLLLPPIRRLTGHGTTGSPAEGTRRRLVGKTVALFFPAVLVSASLVLTEITFTLSVWAAVVLGARALTCVTEPPSGTRNFRGCAGQAVLSGLLFGFAAMVRPVGLLLPIVAMAGGLASLSIAVGARRLRHVVGMAALVVAVGLLMPGCWMLRNHRISGRFALSAIAGVTLAVHRQYRLPLMSPAVRAQLPPLEREFEEAATSSKDGQFAAYVLHCAHPDLNDFVVSDIANRVVWASIREAPGDYVRQTILNTINLLAASAEGLALLDIVAGPRAAFQMGVGEALSHRHWSILLLHGTIRAVGFTFVFVLPVVLLLRRRQEALRDPLLCGLFLVGLTLCGGAAATTITYGRFLMPAIPAIAMAYFVEHRRQGALVPPRTAGALVSP